MKLRASNIGRMKDQTFDVLVLGGGINGAISASALAGRGARTALIDRSDFSSSTSQESSNLIWGGIKYMETMEFGLVAGLCKCRNHLIRSYPSIVKEIRFFVNLDKGFRWGRFSLFMGALLYWFIGRFFTQMPRILSKKKIAEEEPVIDTSESIGGFEYSDAYLHDNDARFVFGFVRKALDHGAIAANYVESLGSVRENGIWHTKVRDTISGEQWTIHSRVLVNACGPYVDEQNQLSSVKTLHRHLFSKGIHLIVNRLTPHRKVLTFFADDGRLFFIIPMGTVSCVGTTDTRVETLPAVVTPEDRKFVLDNINKRLNLPSPLTENDVIAERCGVRPLVVNPKTSAKDKGDWTSLSRKHAVEAQKESAQISIFGGKLTDCLNVGEEVSELVESFGVQLPFPDAVWYGEPAPSVRSVFYHQAMLMGLDQMTAPESSEDLSDRLWRRYGTGAFALLEDIREDPAMAEVLIKGTEYIRCELYLAAQREMVTKLDDFLRRRSKISMIERKETIRNAPGLTEACRILFGTEAQAKLDEYFRA